MRRRRFRRIGESRAATHPSLARANALERRRIHAHAALGGPRTNAGVEIGRHMPRRA
jgi:hypothetical protein